MSRSEVHYTEGRSRQASIMSGGWWMLRVGEIPLVSLRELVKKTEDWPERSRVSVSKDHGRTEIRITDTRQDWGSDNA